MADIVHNGIRVRFASGNGQTQDYILTERGNNPRRVSIDKSAKRARLMCDDPFPPEWVDAMKAYFQQEIADYNAYRARWIARHPEDAQYWPDIDPTEYDYQYGPVA